MCLGFQVWWHAGMASALEPSAVQGSWTPVPDGTRGSEQEPAWNTNRPHFQVSAHTFICSVVCLTLCVSSFCSFSVLSSTISSSFWLSFPICLPPMHTWLCLSFSLSLRDIIDKWSYFFVLMSFEQAGTFAVPSSVWGGASTLFPGDEAVHLDPKPVQRGQCPGRGAHLQYHDW